MRFCFDVVGASNAIIYYEGLNCSSLEPQQYFGVGMCTVTEDGTAVKVMSVISGADVEINSYISGDALYFVDEYDDNVVESFHLVPTGSEGGCRATEDSSVYVTSECRRGII